MFYIKPNQAVCGSCERWAGERGMDEAGFIYVNSGCFGECQITHERKIAEGKCAIQKWEVWHQLSELLPTIAVA